MERIVAKALPHVDDHADPSKVEDDWIAHFFEECRVVTDEEMQELWARVLAGEANAPGKYQKRTVRLIGTLDRHDAEAFASICRFMVSGIPVVYDHNDKIYNDHGVNFLSLRHLNDIGLVRFDSHGGFVLEEQPEKIVLSYGGNVLELRLQEKDRSQSGYKWQAGKVMFTAAGEQLAELVEVGPVPDFVEYLVDKWLGLNTAVSSPWRKGGARV